MTRTSAVSPADGPVAVTGASGYIGSWIGLTTYSIDETLKATGDSYFRLGLLPAS